MKEQTLEHWLPVKYRGELVPGYEVSDLGNVRSLARDRLVSINRRGHSGQELWKLQGKLLKRVMPGQGSGLPTVHLYTPEGERITVAVKRLVAEAFLLGYDYADPKFRANHILHRNMEKSDCSAANLFIYEEV